MSSHTVIIKGKYITDFLVFKIREGIDSDINNCPNGWDTPMYWDIMTNTYKCAILCDDEQLTFIKLKYA